MPLGPCLTTVHRGETTSKFLQPPLGRDRPPLQPVRWTIPTAKLLPTLPWTILVTMLTPRGIWTTPLAGSSNHPARIIHRYMDPGPCTAVAGILVGCLIIIDGVLLPSTGRLLCCLLPCGISCTLRSQRPSSSRTAGDSGVCGRAPSIKSCGGPQQTLGSPSSPLKHVWNPFQHTIRSPLPSGTMSYTS